MVLHEQGNVMKEDTCQKDLFDILYKTHNDLVISYRCNLGKNNDLFYSITRGKETSIKRNNHKIELTTGQLRCRRVRMYYFVRTNQLRAFGITGSKKVKPGGWRCVDRRRKGHQKDKHWNSDLSQSTCEDSWHYTG